MIMRRLLALWVIVVGLLAFAGGDEEAGVPPIFRPIVRILIQEDNNFFYRGTGFFITSNLVATAAHVVTKVGEDIPLIEVKKKPIGIGETVKVKIWTGEEKDAWVALRNPEADICILKTTEHKNEYFIPPNFRLPKVGEELLVLGTIREGHLRVPVKVINTYEIEWSDTTVPDKRQIMLFYSPSLIPGTSGSPLVDSEGWAIAIHVGGAYRTFGIATPFAKLEKEIKEIIKECKDEPNRQTQQNGLRCAQ